MNNLDLSVKDTIHLLNGVPQNLLRTIALSIADNTLDVPGQNEAHHRGMYGGQKKISSRIKCREIEKQCVSKLR